MEGTQLMVLFAQLIVLFDLRLSRATEGNEVFGQGFPWEQSLLHNLEGEEKRAKNPKRWRKESKSDH